MDGWELRPEEVQSTLEDTQTQAQEVAGKLGESVFTSLQEHLTSVDAGGAPVNGITGQVPMAVSNLITDQQADLKSIFTTIEAAIWGAVGVGQEIVKGTEEQVSVVLTAAAEAGVDGDLSAFAPYGWVETVPAAAPQGAESSAGPNGATAE